MSTDCCEPFELFFFVGKEQSDTERLVISFSALNEIAEKGKVVKCQHLLV